MTLSSSFKFKVLSMQPWPWRISTSKSWHFLMQKHKICNDQNQTLFVSNGWLFKIFESYPRKLFKMTENYSMRHQFWNRQISKYVYFTIRPKMKKKLSSFSNMSYKYERKLALPLWWWLLLSFSVDNSAACVKLIN